MRKARWTRRVIEWKISGAITLYSPTRPPSNSPRLTVRLDGDPAPRSPTRYRDDFLESDPFVVARHRFRLVAFLDGSKRTGDHVGVFLQCISPGTVPVAFSFYFLDVDRKRVNLTGTCNVFRNRSDWGFAMLYPISKLEHNEDRLVNENTITVGCVLNVSLSDDAAVEGQAPDPKPNAAFERIDSTDAHAAATDLVALACGGRIIRVEKKLLAARSSVFESMLEYSVDDESAVEITGMDADTLSRIVEYMRTERLDLSDASQALSVFVASDRFNMCDLRRQSARALATMLTARDVADVLLTLETKNSMGFAEEEELFAVASGFAARHLSEVCTTEAWPTVLASHLRIVNSVFSTAAMMQGNTNLWKMRPEPQFSSSDEELNI